MITNSGANALTDYQVLIEVDTATLISAGKMRSDAGDLRFTDSADTELSYWIESGVNTSATKIWVEVPSIPASGTTTIYMYYGNPDVTSTSSGSNTFEFFDDFEGGLGKWTNFGSPSPGTFSSAEFHDGWGYSTEGDSWYPSGSYSKTLVNVAGGIVVEARLKVKNSTSDWDYLGLGIGSLQSGYNDGSGTPGTLGEVYFSIHVSGAQYPDYAVDKIAYHNMWWDHPRSDAALMEANDFGWHRYTIKYDPETTIASYYKDGVFKVENSSGPRPYDTLPVVMCGRDYYNTNYLDFVFVRKYADPEPTYAFGSEEQVPAVNEPPVASFTYSPTTPTTDDIIQFTDTSTDPDGTVVSWSWDFGDGTTSTSQNPTHQYPTAGTYTVALTVTDNGGATDDYSTTVSVSLANQPPTASFVYEPTSPTTTDTVYFTDRSTDPDGTVVSWSWDFGDGTTSTSQNPTHQYPTAGTYTVTLIVTDDDGDTSSTSQEITVSTPPMPEEYLFYDNFDGASLDQTRWPTQKGSITVSDGVVHFDYPGSNYAGAATSVFDYSSGIIEFRAKYTRDSTVSRFGGFGGFGFGLYGSGSEWFDREIHLWDAIVHKAYTLAPDSQDVWHTYRLVFDGREVKAYFDGELKHTIPQHGNFAQLAIGNLGEPDRAGDAWFDYVWIKEYTPVNQPPTASFVYEPTFPTTTDTIYFTDRSTDPDGTVVSWSWDFGDGTTSTSQNPIHQYSSAGTYTVRLTVTDDYGNADSCSINISVSTLEVLSGYQYREAITIINSGPNLTDYQMMFEVDTASLISAGKMRLDCGDLRFTNPDGSVLPYWIESGVNTSATKVWVKIPSIPTGTSVIYMHYGNPTATSASDGDATFEFFDDFSGGLEKWINFGSPAPTTFQSPEFHDGWGYSTEGDSWYPSGSYSKTLVNVAEGIVLEARLKVKNSWSDWDYLGLGIGSLQSGYNDGSGTSGTLGEVYFSIHVSGAQYPDYAVDKIAYHNMWWDHPRSDAALMEANDFGWHRYTIKYDPSTANAAYFCDGVFKADNYGGPRPHDTLPVVVCGRDYYGTNFLDWVFVRKYASIEPTYSFEVEEKTPTSVLVSSQTSVVPAGDSIPISVTLKDGAGTPLPNQNVTLSASFGTIIPSSVITDTLGRASATYMAPVVATPTPATITATFAGDAQYSGGEGVLTITVSPELTAVSLEISPLEFEIFSEESVVVVVVALDESYNRLAGKTIIWGATVGSVSQSVTVTDSQGQASVTYTAPAVDIQTAVLVTATFEGDNEYESSMAISRGMVFTPIVESSMDNLRETLERLEFKIDELTRELQAMKNAISEGRVGVSVSIEVEIETGAHRVRKEFEHEVTIEVKHVSIGNKIELEVSSDVENGRTVVVNIDDEVFPDLHEAVELGRAAILFNDRRIEQADNYEDVLNPTDEDDPEYFLMKGVGGVQVLVSTPRFSPHTIAIVTLPTVPSIEPLPIHLIIVAAIVIVIGILVIIWRHLSIGGKAIKF